MFLQVFKPFAVLFPGVVRLGGRGGVGWGRGGGGVGIRRSFILCHAQNTGIHGVFACLYNTLRKGHGTRHVNTSIHAIRDHAKNIGICTFFASLYNILHKDVEQGKLSQASMPLATMPKTLVFTTFSFFYVLRIADSGLTRSISETETQCNKE